MTIMGLPVTGSIAGVQSIELVPPLDGKGVLRRLANVLAGAECLRAAVAYWCIEPDAVSALLIPAVSGRGFLCADIHLPTNIDILAGMKESGAEVYLHLLHPNPQPGELKTRVPPHLMHTKVLLFDLGSEGAELWVGSHNWTNRALSGLNIEASLVVRMSQECPLYADAEALLEHIRSLCAPFETSHVRYYKWLQEQLEEGKAMWVLELRSGQPSSLQKARVTVFGVSEEDFKNLKTVDKDLIVLLEDDQSGKESRFFGRIVDTGRTNAAGIGFEKRFHAFSGDADRPLVVGPSEPTGRAVSAARYWASVRIEEPLPEGCQLLEMGPRDPWVPSPEDSFEKRMDSEARRLFADPSRPLVSRPNPAGEQRVDGSRKEYATAPAEARRLFRKVLVRGLPKSR